MATTYTLVLPKGKMLIEQKDYTNRFGRKRKTKTTLDLIKGINNGK
jgi:hypothetical protein